MEEQNSYQAPLNFFFCTNRSIVIPQPWLWPRSIVFSEGKKKILTSVATGRRKNYFPTSWETWTSCALHCNLGTTNTIPGVTHPGRTARTLLSDILSPPQTSHLLQYYFITKQCIQVYFILLLLCMVLSNIHLLCTSELFLWSPRNVCGVGVGVGRKEEGRAAWASNYFSSMYTPSMATLRSSTTTSYPTPSFPGKSWKTPLNLDMCNSWSETSS